LKSILIYEASYYEEILMVVGRNKRVCCARLSCVLVAQRRLPVSTTRLAATLSATEKWRSALMVSSSVTSAPIMYTCMSEQRVMEEVQCQQGDDLDEGRASHTVAVVVITSPGRLHATYSQALAFLLVCNRSCLNFFPGTTLGAHLFDPGSDVVPATNWAAAACSVRPCGLVGAAPWHNAWQALGREHRQRHRCHCRH
jgi:hypothetical protein